MTVKFTRCRGGRIVPIVQVDAAVEHIKQLAGEIGYRRIRGEPVHALIDDLTGLVSIVADLTSAYGKPAAKGD
jgi:hypothetical protein